MAFYVILRTFFVDITVIQNSMHPTVKEGERVLILKHSPIRWLRRNQVIILQPESWMSRKHHNPSRKDFLQLKRLVGLPGDRILIDFNKVEKEAKEIFSQNIEIDSKGKTFFVVPPGHVFVKGDNPAESYDSFSYGPIPFSRLHGIAIIKLPSRHTSHSQPVN